MKTPHHSSPASTLESGSSTRPPPPPPVGHHGVYQTAAKNPSPLSRRPSVTGTPLAQLAKDKLGINVSLLNLSDDELVKLILAFQGQAVSNQKKTVTLVQPSVGSIDDTGVFT